MMTTMIVMGMMMIDDDHNHDDNNDDFATMKIESSSCRQLSSIRQQEVGTLQFTFDILIVIIDHCDDEEVSTFQLIIIKLMT